MKMNERLNTKMSVELMKGAKAPSIYIEELAMAKMKEYIKGCDDEIGWLATVEKHSESVYRIVDAYLFKQEVHCATTEITPDGLNDFAMELLQIPNGMDIWNSIKCWGHSHVNMSVSPSSQDNDQMNVFKDIGHDFFIRVIANKKGEMEFTLYDYRLGVIYSDVPWAILRDEETANQINSIRETIKSLQEQLTQLEDSSYPELELQIKEEIKLKVSKKTYNTVKVCKGGKEYTKYGTAYGAIDDYNYSWYNRYDLEEEEQVGNYGYKLSECIHYQDLEDWFLLEEIVDLVFCVIEDDNLKIKEYINSATKETLSDADFNYIKRLILDYGYNYGYIVEGEYSATKNALLEKLYVVKE